MARVLKAQGVLTTNYVIMHYKGKGHLTCMSQEHWMESISVFCICLSPRLVTQENI